MSRLEIVGGDGDPLPPTAFEKQLRAFDINLRVVWGARPYARPCWVIERKVPPELYYKTYLQGKDPELDRYAEQTIYNDNGTVFGKRLYDMMPTWHPVYFVINSKGEKLDLDSNVIEYLRRHYEQTLLGIPEIGIKTLITDHAKVEAEQAKRKEDRVDRAAREVMDHKTEIWKDYFGFGGQPRQVLEGTELQPSSGEEKVVN